MVLSKLVKAGPVHGFRMAIPFTGLDGPGEAAMRLKCGARQNNLWEWDKRLLKYLKSRFGNDFRNVDIKKLLPHEYEDAEVLFCGAPCQPHTQLGLKLGEDDERTEEFWCQLDMAEELDRRGVLLMVVFENSKGVLCKKKIKG